MYSIQDYLNAIIRDFNTCRAEEHSYRPHLKQLLEEIGKNQDVLAINEPKREKFGAPDFLIYAKGTEIGFVETKDIKVNRLNNLDDREKEQKQRYIEGAPNLIYTDYLEFIFYYDQQEIAKIKIADFDGKNIIPITENFDLLKSFLNDFFLRKAAVIKSPSRLAELMAGKARLVADSIYSALLDNTEENKSLWEQLESFRKILIKTITEKEFSDIYAQTIAYGMFVARLHDETLSNFTRQEAGILIPKSIPFLRKMFEYVAGNDIDDRILWAVDSLANIFSYTDVADILKNFGRSTKTTDPIVHFYETFLSKYDNGLRKDRGVYYTPQPVVDYIVRAVDKILKTEFGLPDGLADKSTITRKVYTQGTTKKIDKEFHRVQVLDPATGTGTFLATTINFIHDKFTNNQGIWPTYVNKDLLPRLHGFEIMMSSYTMAHLKLDLVLRETGYIQTNARINNQIFRQDNIFDRELAEIKQNSTILNTNNRIGIYLTNALEAPDPNAQDLLGAQWLSNEAKEADNIKQNIPVMCIIGNPPYKAASMNKNKYIMQLIDAYKKEPGGKTKLKERNSKWINDDYAKFIRLAEHFIETNGSGIVAYITNNGFLDNPTFRGMRWHLLNTFDKCYIINLHGNSTKRETCPNGTTDENVFNIAAVGTSINIFIKTCESTKNSLADIYYTDIWGTKEHKYDILMNTDLYNTNFKLFKPTAPSYAFIPQDNPLWDKYNEGIDLQELFQLNSVGIVTARDTLTIHNTKKQVQETILDFANLDSETARNKYNLGKDVRDWSVKGAQQDLLHSGFNNSLITQIAYRVLDNKYTYYTGNSKGFQCMARARARAMNHIIGHDNAVILLERIVNNKSKPYADVFMTDKIWDAHMLGSACYGFPLYTYFNNEKQSNMKREIVRKIEKNIGKTSPELIFDYIYGILHSPSYRAKYHEFLKIDFPRIPYPKNKSDFEHYRKYGEQLRKLHLMESMLTTTVRFQIIGDNMIDKLKYENNRVYINQSQYFDNVPQTAWDFFIGGYQPAQKYLKDRRDRTLSHEEILHYEKIIAILLETDKIMKEIDFIECH